MLRVDNRVTFITLPLTLSGLFRGRIAVSSRKTVYPKGWKKKSIESVLVAQQEHPIPVHADTHRTLWHFHDKFFWDDEGLHSDDVKALVLQRERRRDQQLRTAHSLMKAAESGRPTRVAISSDLRRAVYERDGGACVECGSAFQLQYDHVLAVARGGATTLENLQLLCADCNQRKSDSI